MKVLSLFDGISCGRVAFDRAGIPVESYFASEIEKYPIQIAKKNYPDTVQLGDVQDWREWDLADIDILIGGSPCQGFSFAGKQLNFDDPRSQLFFEFYNILVDKNPKYFLLENVKMNKKSEAVITEMLGVEPIEINSSLVSAQNRKRLYWTNIPGFEQPKDKGILLKDIVLDDVYPVALHNLYGGFKEKAVRVFEGKSPTLRTAAGGGHIPSFVSKAWGVAVRGRYKSEGGTHQVIEPNGTEKANELTTVSKDSMYLVSDVVDWFKGRPYSDFKDLDIIRKFHPIECERLQTLPDNYTEGISNTQRYKAIGNGWTVDVIAHILSYIPEEDRL
jgi:DNA-cytosine methyltransferase